MCSLLLPIFFSSVLLVFEFFLAKMIFGVKYWFSHQSGVYEHNAQTHT